MAKLKPEIILNQAVKAQLERFAQMPDCRLAFGAPVKIVSEANGREHWGAKNRRKQAQQLCVEVHWKNAAKRQQFTPPFVVHLHRIGQNFLDDDNLANGFKGCRDKIARLLGIDDGSAAIKFVYTQEALGARQYAIVVAVQEKRGG